MRWIIALTLATLCSLLANNFTLAQSQSTLKSYDIYANVPTNIEGIHTFAPPPAGFDPISASDEELAMYGFPPRPHKDTDPEAYRVWAKGASSARVRSTAPLKVTNRFNMPYQPGLSQSQSTNWSGFVNTKPKLTEWNDERSVAQVVSVFNVPTVHEPFGVCINSDYSASFWNGIDGFLGSGSNDVLQGGVEGDTTCVNGFNEPTYYAWIEWFPNPETPVFGANPGDTILVLTWDTNPTTGYVHIIDETTETYGTWQLTPPSGTTLTGNSAEWIVERPTINGSLTPLANYTEDFWAQSYGWDFYHQNNNLPANLYPGSKSDNNYLVTMTNNSGSQDISFPTAEGLTGIYFQVENCAYSGGC